MEYIFNDIIPTYWKQGYFWFDGQKRIATVTDVKFISDNDSCSLCQGEQYLRWIELNSPT